MSAVREMEDQAKRVLRVDDAVRRNVFERRLRAGMYDRMMSDCRSTVKNRCQEYELL